MASWHYIGSGDDSYVSRWIDLEYQGKEYEIVKRPEEGSERWFISEKEGECDT